MTTQILFIRHGETAWNRLKRIQGHLDIPLSPSGEEQARQLASRLAGEAARGARLDAIWSSDLGRARQTAQPTAQALGLLPLRLSEGLRERLYGAFQGHDDKEVAARFPDGFARWQAREADFAPPAGESLRAFYQRVVQAAQTIVAAHRGQRIACFTHGGVLDCLYRFARGLALETPRDYPLLNASINAIDFEDSGQARIVSWADIGHLDGASDDDGFSRAPASGR
ncbi:histidine phosphatase family protein [Burkholderia sp. WAC0059]|uniref:histidine phosphatase family protein n=1 Tax=Burkholderia sp. WAC0059 TaxID=2066022 RepID=UPI000C7EA728|nr:histidine phosphatase family protein [Burkholderia sp. WAC0059]PLZ03317.1 histidine phosphatase family protein [Burkholderia sp. WAC0059]